jgi:hypothetical protein
MCQVLLFLIFEFVAGINHLYEMREKNPHAVALGKIGGSKGGKTRAARLTPEERSASAKKAAVARWAKFKKSKERKQQ